MKCPKMCLAAGLLVTIVIGVSGQKSTGKKIELKQTDKSEILKQVFADGFETLIQDKTFSQCTIPLVSDKHIILIETNEPKIFPTALGEYHFRFLNRSEIEAEIKSNDGDCYFKINNFQAIDSKTAKITLWRWINVITVVNGKSWYPSRWVAARGRVYEATKVSKKWKVRFKDSVWAVS